MNVWKTTSLLVVCGASLGVLTGGCGDDSASTSNGGSGATGATVSGSTTGKTSSVTHASVTDTGTGGAMGEGICGSDLLTQSQAQNACLTDACCASYNPCYADADCNACLQDPTGTGCDTNALFATYSTCEDSNCPTGLCTGMLSTPSPELNLCVNTNCCASETPCEADSACNACLLDPTPAACETNTLYQAYKTCEDANCPTGICTAPIQFANQFDDQTFNIDIAKNKCAGDNCCTEITGCADPTGDGYLDMSDPEVSACILCLNDDPSCAAGAVKTAADAFNACLMTNCP